MSFGIGVILYILGSIVVAICLIAIPGSGGRPQPEGPADDAHGHGH